MLLSNTTLQSHNRLMRRHFLSEIMAICSEGEIVEKEGKMQKIDMKEQVKKGQGMTVRIGEEVYILKSLRRYLLIQSVKKKSVQKLELTERTANGRRKKP